MKTTTHAISTHLSGYGLLIIAACLLFAPAARAGLTVDIHLYHDTYGYYFYSWLNVNTNTPNFPTGYYMIASPQIPTNGSQLQYQATNNTLNYLTGGGNYYGDFNSFLYGITNGQWSIWVTNSTSTNQYKFTVTVSGVTSNVFGAPAVAVFPINGAQFVTNQPLFQWTGPANWAGALNVIDYFIDTNGNWNYGASASVPPNQTSWPCPVVLPNGTNAFSVDYQSNVTAQIIASQPTNNAGQPISGWVSTATLESDFVDYNVLFIVGQSLPGNDYDPFLVARYNFEDTNNPNSDSSGNNNNPDCSSSSGTNYDTFSTNAAVGQYARLFFGDTSFCFTQADPAYQNLSNALSENFSVTAWVKTTNSVNTETANAYFGAPIFFAAADYNNHCTIPLSITGSKAAFTIVSSDGPGTVTLHSTTSVNDGNYHFLAVTRQQSSGLMSVYVDGNLEVTGTGITNPVITQGYISIAGGYYSYSGLLDDVRIYATNLSAGDVASLGNGGSAPTLAKAIGATNLTVTTSGDANWFVETTNTFNGALFAAQSGSVSNYQSSTLSATVTGPGKLTFYWSSQDNDPNQNLDYEFYIDDPSTNDIADLYGGGNDWQSIEQITGGPVIIPAGQHTLYWTVFANGDTDPFQAGFLDQVIFTPPDTNPVAADITLDIYRGQNPTFGDIYIAWPLFNSVTPAGTGNTTNIVQSPNGMFSAQASAVGGGSSSWILSSLNQLINEFTNGLWTLYINKGLPTERQFHFSVSVSGLTTNLLSVVKIITPTNGAIGVPPNASFQWTGPTNYSSLSVSKQKADGSGYVSATLPLTAANWPSPPVLAAGTNQFDVNYTSNGFPNMTFTIPVDTNDSQTVSSWVTHVDLHSTATSVFIVTAGPLPTALLSPQDNGVNFQFQFLSQAGFNHSILYRTNLAAGNWQTNSTIAGDGTLKTISIPLSVFSPSKQGFIRLSTQ